MIPLVLHDGTKIDTSNGSIIREQEVLPAGYVEVVTNSDAVEVVSRTERRISDLPDRPDNLHPVTVILGYHLFGLSDQQIAIATNTSLDYVQKIMDGDAFVQMKNTIAEDFITMQRETVMGILEAGSKNAAQRQVAMLNSQDEAVVLAASKQILDRTLKEERNSKRVRMPSLNISVITDAGKQDMKISMGD